MTPYSPILVAATAVVSLSGCTTANQTVARGDRVVATTNNETIRMHDGPTSGETMVNAPPQATLAALNAAYTGLGIEVKL